MTRLISPGLLLGAAMSTWSGEPGARSISLIDCLQLALERNLDIQISRHGPEIAKFTLSGAYGVYDPSFNFNYAHSYALQPPTFSQIVNRVVQGSSTDTDNYNMGIGGVLPTGLTYSFTSGPNNETWGAYQQATLNGITNFPINSANSAARVTLTQPLLKNFWIDGNRLNIAISRSNLKISKLALQQQIMTTVSQVEQAYYSLIAMRDAVKVQQVALQLAQQLLSENKKRVEVGVLAPLDEKQAESQVAASKADLLGAQNQVLSAQNGLKTLITDRFTDWQDVTLEPAESLSATPQTFSRQDSWAKGLSLRPDLLQARETLAQRHVSLKYSKNQLYPELDVSGSYGRVGASQDTSLWDAMEGVREGSGNNFSYGVSLSIPLGNRSARQQYRIAKENVEQMLLQLKKQEQGIMVELDNLIAQARTSLQQVEANKAAAEYADQALQAEQKKLDNGKSTSFQVLQLQNNLTAAQYRYLSSLMTYNTTLSSLALSEGTILDRHHITLEVR